MNIPTVWVKHRVLKMVKQVVRLVTTMVYRVKVKSKAIPVTGRGGL
jgi:hypothetical protein